MDVVLQVDDAVRVLLALLVGATLGLERQARDKAAGLRTLICICVGATVFTLLSQRLGTPQEQTRIAANIVNGIGFLGGGVILRHGNRVMGVTTAATIWLASALGMGLAGDQTGLVLFTVALALVVLGFLPRLERVLERLHEERSYEVTCRTVPGRMTQLADCIRVAGLRMRNCDVAKSGPGTVFTWRLAGSRAAHERLAEDLLADPDVLEFHV